MSASPAVMNQPMGQVPLAGDDKIVVSTRWRIGQIVVSVLVLLLALYYNTAGYKSPPGESGRLDIRTWQDQIGFVILLAMVWMAQPAAGVIAMTTFQEALRRRWMTALLAFALVMLTLSTFFTWMQPGEEEKFLRDFGVGFIVIISLLMAIFLGVALVPPEVERRTIFTILSKPVNRLDFLLGKFLGLCLTLAVNLVIMTVMFLISYAIFKGRREGWAVAMAVGENHPGLAFDLMNMARGLVLHFGQLAVMSSLALLLSLVVSNITAIVFCFLAYFGGHMSSYWEHLGGGGEQGGDHAEEDREKAHLSGPIQGVVKVVYWVLPRLDRFEVRERLVNEVPVAFNYMWKAYSAGLIYVAALLIISYLFFSDREF